MSRTVLRGAPHASPARKGCPIRAKILYNHIFFSDLPDPYKRALLEDSRYRTILRHDNYNPRIIGHMTQARHVAHLPVAMYFPNFIENMDNPTRIWDHAFRNQLSEPAQHLLLLMASMPDEVLLRDLEFAFNRFFQYRRTKLGFACSSRDFERALKELDGNFIKTSLIGKDQIATFHNPSVSDFLENYLYDSSSDVLDLFESAAFFDQFIHLWQGKAGTRFRGVEQYSAKFTKALANHFYDPNCKVIRMGDHEGKITGAKPWQSPLEARISFAIEVADGLGTPDSRSLVGQLLRTLQNRLKEGQGDRESLVRLLRKLRAQFSESEETQSLLVAARDFLTTGLENITDFSCLAMFMSDDPATMSPLDLDRIRREFRGFCETCDLWDSDPDWLRQQADEIETVGSALDVEVHSLCSDLRDRADELENEQKRSEYEPDDSDSWSSLERSTEDIDTMFAGLLHEIDERLPG